MNVFTAFWTVAWFKFTWNKWPNANFVFEFRDILMMCWLKISSHRVLIVKYSPSNEISVLFKLVKKLIIAKFMIQSTKKMDMLSLNKLRKQSYFVFYDEKAFFGEKKCFSRKPHAKFSKHYKNVRKQRDSSLDGHLNCVKNEKIQKWSALNLKLGTYIYYDIESHSCEKKHRFFESKKNNVCLYPIRCLAWAIFSCIIWLKQIYMQHSLERFIDWVTRSLCTAKRWLDSF